MLKEKIYQYLINKNGKIISSRLRESWFLKNNLSSLYKEIMNHTSFLDKAYPFQARIKLILQGHRTIPGCKLCGQPVRYTNTKWMDYCSRKCSTKVIANKESVKRKKRETNLERYVCASPFESEKVKEKIQETNLKRHGVKNVGLLRKKEVDVDRLISDHRKFSLKTSGKNQDISAVLAKKILNDNGINTSKLSDNFTVTSRIDIPDREEFKEKFYKDRKTFNELAKHYSVSSDTIRKWFYDVFNLEFVNNYTPKSKYKDFDINWLVNEHYEKKKSIKKISSETGIDDTVLGRILKKNGYDTRRYLTSDEEKEVLEFLNSNTKYSFKKFKFPNSRSEIDIYCEELKFGIEYNGTINHSSLRGYDRNYHLAKTKRANALGISLIHLFSHEWLQYKDIVKSILLSKCGIFSEKIFARNTDFRNIDNKIAKLFLQENHLQGYTKTIKESYGLFYEEDLKAVICYGNHHRKNNSDLVLTRLCFKKGTQIVGGASKLFSNSKKVRKIVTWSDNRWSEGKVYKKLGFNLEKEFSPSYSYVNGRGEIRSAQSMQKKSIGCPPHIKEEDFCRDVLGFYKFWDCGKKRWTSI